MSRSDRLEQRLRSRPPQVEFEDVRKVLERHGWRLDREEGSHATFVKTGEPRIFTVPRISGRKVKRLYVDRVCNLLGLDE